MNDPLRERLLSDVICSDDVVAFLNDSQRSAIGEMPAVLTGRARLLEDVVDDPDAAAVLDAVREEVLAKVGTAAPPVIRWPRLLPWAAAALILAATYVASRRDPGSSPSAGHAGGLAHDAPLCEVVRTPASAIHRDWIVRTIPGSPSVTYIEVDEILETVVDVPVALVARQGPEPRLFIRPSPGSQFVAMN